MDPARFMTSSLQDWRIARILDCAIHAVDPEMLVARALNNLTLPPHHQLSLLGLGKAAEAMTRAAANSLSNFRSAMLVTKERSAENDSRITVLTAGHPVPDGRSIAAGRAILEFVSQLGEDDLLVCLVSGGASALATAPIDGITLEDLQALTSGALASGATIEEVNVLRRQLDRLKGGGLARATRASILSLVLSDVVGDRLEAIASGPTYPNPTGPQEAMDVITRLGIQTPVPILRALRAPEAPRFPHFPNRVKNLIIGNVEVAARAAVAQARKEGFSAHLLDTRLQGEAQIVGRALGARLAAESREKVRPFCLVAAGETTVTLAEHGVGGRNQELALAAVDVLDATRACLLVALATDGNDGPTDAAGAVASSATGARAASLGIGARDYLARHDSYRFFEPLGDLLRPGYTGTNVNDLVLLIGV